MDNRRMGLLDRLIGEIDRAIKVLTVPAQGHRAFEAQDASGAERDAAATPLSDPDRRRSARLMRVNHAGEVAAQALYRGQGLLARDPAVRTAMHRAASEEIDHLAWCEQRLVELDGRTSALNPLWYAGSFALGALAGSFGDGASLGFVAETERQVESHLGGHLQRLSPQDFGTRAILERMQRDEVRHGETAASLGGVELPWLASRAMRSVSKLMTFGSYWI